MSVSSADYARVVAACRRCLAHGTSLSGDEIRLVIDVVEHGANAIDGVADISAANDAVVALEAVLVTQMGLWNDAGAGDSSTVYTTALAALATPRANAVTLAAAALAACPAAITDITADDMADGRSA